jgi:hypothetical protein
VKINKSVLFLVILHSQISSGQIFSESEIHGKIIVDSIAIEGVNIVNASNGKATISNENGMFMILAKEGDVLAVSAINLITFYKEIKKQDFFKEVVLIKMDIENFALKEVLINEYPRITAENLGIIPFGQKRYTAAERRLKTAGDFKPIMLLAMVGGSMPLDPLINKINGRTKRLKKEVVIEKQEFNMRLVSVLFSEDFFIKKFNIPREYVEGFKYYIVEDRSVVSALTEKNKPMLEFLISAIAIKYNEIIACENE